MTAAAFHTESILLGLGALLTLGLVDLATAADRRGWFRWGYLAFGVVECALAVLGIWSVARLT